MPASINLYSMLSDIGDTFRQARDRQMLSDIGGGLGTSIGGGDYLGAARSLLSAGQFGPGLQLLKMGQEQEQLRQQRGADQRAYDLLGDTGGTSSTAPSRYGADGSGKVSSGGGGPYNVQKAYSLMKSVGATDEEARILAAIAQPESGGNPRAFNPHGADRSYGLWQINMLGGMGPERRAKFGLASNEALFDPVTNARVALKMARDAGGYRDWSTYTSGKYRRYLPGRGGGFSEISGDVGDLPADMQSSILQSRAPLPPNRPSEDDLSFGDVPMPPRRPAELDAAQPSVIMAPSDVSATAGVAGGQRAAPPGTHWARGPGAPLLLRDDMDAATAGMFGQRTGPAAQRGVQVASANPRFVPAAASYAPASAPVASVDPGDQVRAAAARQRAAIAAIPSGYGDSQPSGPDVSQPTPPARVAQADEADVGGLSSQIKSQQERLNRATHALSLPGTSDSFRQRANEVQEDAKWQLQQLYGQQDRFERRRERIDTRDEARRTREDARTPASVREFEYARQNGFAGSYEDFKRLNKNETTVNVGAGENAFNKKVGEGLAEDFREIFKDGRQAQRDSAVFGQLEDLNKELETGGGAALRALAARAGFKIGADVPKLEQFNAIVNYLTPKQREAGSGTMSDRDLALFKETLPALITSKEGNRLIISTFRAMAKHRSDAGAIAKEALAGRLSQGEALDKLNALPNPFDEFLAAGAPGGGQSVAQEGQRGQLRAPDASILDEAKAALSARPDKRDAILNRLRERGYDPSALGQ